MKRSILIAVATIALGAPLAPAADREYGRDDRGRVDHRGYREDHRHHEPRFVVHYHLDGGGRQLRAKSRDRADRMVEFLRSVGARAHSDGRTVYYRMRGEAEAERYSHDDAHKLAQKLEGYGFHAHVDHE